MKDVKKLLRPYLAPWVRAAEAVGWTLATIPERSTWKAATATNVPPSQVFDRVGDRKWLWLNDRGYAANRNLRALLPALPSDDTQLQFTGCAGESTLRHAWRVYRLIKRLCAAKGTELNAGTVVLDFGCGWGRITRFFMKDLNPGNLWGIDCDPAIIATCRRTNRWANFLLVGELPPTDLPGGTFDLIYAYSVFSHLSREAHDQWLREFRRILKPEGLLVVTTFPREFIEKCAWLRTADASSAPASHRYSAGSFPDTQVALAAYDQGEYCFSHRRADDPSHYGDTCLSREFVMDHWVQDWDVLDYVIDLESGEQNVIVSRPRKERK